MSRFIKIYFGPCAINVNFRNMASGKFLICYLRTSRHLMLAELALVLQLQWRAFMGVYSVYLSPSLSARKWLIHFRFSIL